MYVAITIEMHYYLLLHTGLLVHSKQLLEGYKHLVQAYDGKLLNTADTGSLLFYYRHVSSVLGHWST